MNAPEPVVGWSDVIAGLLDGVDLSDGVASWALRQILSGEASAAQIAGFLVALRAKGVSSAELSAMLAEVRAAAVTVTLGDGVRALDIVGTGGDRSGSINVSTTAALIVAAAGARVCKHGNRAASSRCGSADVLEALGIVIDRDANGVAAAVARDGFGFCFAPRFHPAFRHVGPVRKELGVPTVFNLLGPMANPAPVTGMVVGVSDPEVMEPMATALASRGVERAWVVHGADGLDELSLAGDNHVVELADGHRRTFIVHPRDVGLAVAPSAEVVGGDAAHNAAMVRDVLRGTRGAMRDICVLNAAAGLVVAGVSASLVDGRMRAEEAIESGSAAALLDRLVTVDG